MGRLEHFQEIFDTFVGKRKEYQEVNGRLVPQDEGDLPIGGLRTIRAAMMVIDIAGSSNVYEKLGNNNYGNWLGPALHLIFHIVNSFDGFVDKYTGDGAMISFSEGSSQQRCTNALECALRISETLKKIINPYMQKKGYPIVQIRIGIDYGAISVERIGVKSKSHLIIIGGAANFAKKTEQLGKEVEFVDYTTIVFGYDLYYNLRNEDVKTNEGGYLCKHFKNLTGTCETDGSTPIKIYIYTGRYP